MEFYERYVNLCNERGKSPSAVAIEIGLAKPTVNRWKNGSLPTDATVTRIANYFGVTVGYLFGKEQKNPATENDSEISKAKADLIEKVMQMSDADLEKLNLLLQIVEAK